MTVRKRSLILAGSLALGFLATAEMAVRGQGTGVASKVGQKIDQVGRGVGRTVKNGFETVRSDVGNMGIHPRVYSRLHWDKALHGSKIEVHMVREGGVLLKGTVPTMEAKRHAAVLASETVGVTEVVDELISIEPETVIPVSTDVPKAASNGRAVPRLR